MKKLLVFILICLSSTVMLAQKATTLHWTPVKTANNMAMSAVLVIDGEEIGADALNLEIGIFDQNDVCRGAKLPKLKNGRYKYSPMIYGEDGYTYYCKVYNHATGVELDLTFVPDSDDPLIWIPNHTWGTSAEPYEITFTSGATQTFTRDITGYGTNESGGFVLIATPAQVAPEAAGLFTDETATTYDLFRFNQSAELPWENYKTQGEHYHFNLEVGRGYLYASQDDVTFTVTTTPSGTAPIDVPVAYDPESPFAGYNLIGNPFTTPASLGDVPYYTLDGTGTYFDPNAGTDNIGCMYGVLIEATSAMTSVSFTPSTTKSERRVVPTANIVVSTNGKNVDKAIIRFDEGATLGKFQLHENSTKVYLPQNGRDYAIANATTDEMPLNFKAETTGSYTISLNLNNVNLDYLHLIDRITGEDIDMLIDNEYSFIGSPRDNENRFIVKFNHNANIDELDINNIFAYQNGTDIIVNGNGELQVYDVTGRMVMNTNINGIQTVSAPSVGMYIFRMVGTDVKTQKIVIR